MPSIKDVMDEEGPDPDAPDEPTEGDVPADDAAPTDETAAAGPQDIGSEEPTPEEQAQYEKLVMAGTKVLYDDATHEKIVKVLKAGADDPVHAIADATLFILRGLDAASKGTLPLPILPHVAAELGEQVGEFAATAKIFPVDQDTLTKAGMVIFDQLCSQYGVKEEDIQAMMDKTSPEQQEQARSEMDKVANPDDQPMPRDESGGIVNDAMKEPE